jgi:putative ABC transport system permease protein
MEGVPFLMGTATPTREPVSNGLRPAKPTLVFEEIMRFAYDTFCMNKIRFTLTALGMVIGTASLILVVTIGLTGKQYILGQIQAIGANMIYAYYEGGGSGAVSTIPQDYLTVNDMNAVREQVPGIRASSPMIQVNDRISVGNGKERDILVLGVSPEYAQVRNLLVLSGRFFDADDTAARNKVALMTEKFARKMYGSPENAVGQTMKLSGLPFTVIGTFRERVETFGQS